jgi:hypothetical protein
MLGKNMPGEVVLGRRRAAQNRWGNACGAGGSAFRASSRGLASPARGHPQAAALHQGEQRRHPRLPAIDTEAVRRGPSLPSQPFLSEPA